MNASNGHTELFDVLLLSVFGGVYLFRVSCWPLGHMPQL